MTFPARSTSALAFALALAAATGCKTDSPAASPPARGDDTAARPQPAPTTAQAPARTESQPPTPQPSLPAQSAAPDEPRGRNMRDLRARMDTDGDGKISDEERSTAMHGRAEMMHQRLDANGDGKLSPDELSNAGGRRMRFDDPAALDTNHDGDISSDELAAGIKARADERRARRRAGSDSSGQ